MAKLKMNSNITSIKEGKLYSEVRNEIRKKSKEAEEVDDEGEGDD
jgi:hypothetical protein